MICSDVALSSIDSFDLDVCGLRLSHVFFASAYIVASTSRVQNEFYKYCFPPKLPAKKLTSKPKTSRKRKAQQDENEDNHVVLTQLPAKKSTSKPKASRKRKTQQDENEDNHVVLTLGNNDDFEHKFIVTSDVFHSWEKDEDFAVLTLPKVGFTMPRIPISLCVSLTLKIHAFGYVGHTKQFNVSGGEISGLLPDGFAMNLLSAGGYSGAAIIADGCGRAVGYMGGNLDASKEKNSQHQSYGIRSSVLILSNEEGEVLATVIVWDYTDSKVLLLTNYHTWDSREYKYCFPPKLPAKKSTSKPKASRKRKTQQHEDNHVVLTLGNNDDFEHKFIVTSDVFHSWEKDEDFAVLTLPKVGFTMPRIPISLCVSLTLKIHAFGYVGHTKQFNVSGGEISGLLPDGFAMNLLSAGGYSGAAIIADGCGRAVGYMGGNLDASKEKNSQHQSYGYRFDRVFHATGRQLMTPTNSPAGKGTRSAVKGAK
eukprot:gene11366-12698_t